MISVALVHYPIVNKRGEIVTTSVTNIDLHDIARASRTYGVDTYFVVTPSKLQQTMVGRVVGHWLNGYGAEYNSNRTDAIQTIKLVDCLQDAVDICPENTRVVATSARVMNTEKSVTFSELREKIKSDENILLVFGTGWGLADESIGMCDMLLEPIQGKTGYNHLSVRSAVSIILDRLLQ